jgi:NADH:ubiquinone oxidoreductase subunit K
MPTGTQGGIGLADGFSESAWRNHGSWTAETANEIRDQMMRDSDVANLPGIEFEKEHSRRCGEAARRWIRNNKDRLLQLSWWKLSRLWECGSLLHTILFAVMFVGLFISRQTVISQIMLLLLTLNSLTVMATYHTYERFFTPFRPLLHGFVAAAVVACIRTAMNTCLEPSARHRQE